MSAGENGPEGKSSWKSRWAEKPRWLRLTVKIALILLCGAFVLSVLLSFPFVRAAGYPFASIITGTDVNISEYCPVYTSDEKPGFLIRSSSHLFYDIKAYRNSPSLPQESFPARRDEQPSNIPNLARFPSSYSAQGFITPRDLFAAESRVDLPVLPVGDYLAIIKTSPLFLGEPKTKWIRFKVTDLGAIIKHDDSKVLITTFNLKTRKPWPNADISLDSSAEQPLRGKTDDKGIAEFKRPSASDEWTYFNIDIKSGDNTAYLGSYENQYEMYHPNDGYLDIQGNFNAYNRRFRTFFTQDKPLYRLGQTIQIRALTRKVTQQGVINPGSGVQARMKIYDANYKEIKNETLTSDQHGGFSIKLNPSEYSATGQYRVELAYPDSQNDTCTFQVDQYRKPEFKVDIVPEKQRFVAGEPIKVRVRANYYFGAPVANTKMKYTVQAHADDASKDSLNEAKGTSRFFDNWQTSDSYHFYGSSARPAVSGEITTDAAGEAVFTVNAKETPVAEVGPYSYRFFDESFTISVEATDLSRKTVTAEGNASMSRGDFALFAQPRRSVLKVGENLEVDLSAFDYDRKPVAKQELKVNLVRWRLKDPLKGTWEVIPIANAAATTDDTGKGSVSFALNDKSPSDQYYVVAEAKDKGGRTVGSVDYVWVIGERTDSWLENDQERQFLKVSLDKPSYKPSEIVRAVVSAPVPNDEEAYLLVALEGTSLHSYKLVNMRGPAAYVEFQVEDKFVPNAYISAAFVGKNHHPRLASAILKVAPEKHFLNCTVSSDKPRYRPGETARFTVKAKEPDGTPAANVQLCASVVDEGLFAIYENLKRQTYMYEQGKADIFNAIFSLVDNEVETRFTFTDSHQVTVPEHPFFDGAGLALIFGWFGRSYICEQDLMMCKAGAPMLQGATNGTIGRQMMDAAAPAAMPAPRAEMSAEGGAAPPRRGRSAPEPRVRSNFLDSIGWFPTLLTDSGGTATFSVKLPDDLTTWRTTVNGVSLQTQLASAQNTTLSTQDFLARLALPRFYTEGDETSVAGLIHNLSGKVQEVTVSVATSENLKLNEPATKQVTLAKDEVKRVSWTATAGKTGTAEVTLKAIGGTTSDAEKRTLPVNAYGYRIYFAKNGILKNPSDIAKFPLLIPTDAKLDNGQLALSMSSSAIGPVLGNFEKLIEYPYGCTEQTLSRLIPSVVSMRLAKDLQIEVTPEVRAKHAKVYDIAMPKLTDYHHPDGGWGWWKEDKSDPYMTAHVVEGLYLLRKAGFSVDQSLIDSGLSFLQSQVSALAGQSWNLDPATDQAKSIYVLSLFDRSPNPAEKLWQMAKLSKAPPEALAYLTIAFKNKGDKVAAQQAYSRLKSLANESLEYTSWDHTKAMLEKMGLKDIWDYTYRFSDVETTALALRAAAVMEPENSELLERITRWLILERDEDGWGNTKSTSAVFLALLEKELATKPNRTTNFKAKIDTANALITEVAFNKTFERREERVIVPLKNRPAGATISKNGPGWLYYSSLLEYDRPLKSGEQPLLKSIPSDLKVQEDFFRLVAPAAQGQTADKNVAGGTTTYKLEEMGEKPLAPGDIVMMRVVVDSPFAIPYAMVEAALPSGGEVLRTPPSVDQKLPGQKADKAGAVEETAWFWWTHQDILDDRIAFFSSSLPAGKNEFRAFIRVEMPGKFNINPVTMEAMYTDKVHARSTAHTIVVKE